jgi:hypothetical protein
VLFLKQLIDVMVILWRSFEPLQNTRQIASYADLQPVLQALQHSLHYHNEDELNVFVEKSLQQLTKEPLNVIEMREYLLCKRRDIF